MITVARSIRYDYICDRNCCSSKMLISGTGVMDSSEMVFPAQSSVLSCSCRDCILSSFFVRKQRFQILTLRNGKQASLCPNIPANRIELSNEITSSHTF